MNGATCIRHAFSSNTFYRFWFLFSITDWLDNGNNKKALQETEKLLKKQPNLQCARVFKMERNIDSTRLTFQCFQVLKALAMIRLGRAEEAHVILKEVQLEEPCDDATLQGMVICYRETHRRELKTSQLVLPNTNILFPTSWIDLPSLWGSC